MASAVIERWWRDSTPERVDTDLAALWRDLGRQAPVARALVANLVVFCDRPVDRAIDLGAELHVPLDEVSRRHPARVIVLHHARSRTDACPPIAAAIGVLAFGPPHARYGIEQIAIRSACSEASLPSIVRRLTLGDLPTSLWWTEDLSRASPLGALVAISRQIVYDSRQWRNVGQGILALAPLLKRPQAPDLADLNWRRLAPMRQAILHAVDSLSRAAGMPLSNVRVRHRPGDAALATLLVGWLSARLGWTSESRAPIVVEESLHADEVLSMSWDDVGMTTAMNRERVIVQFRDGTAPFVVAVRHESEADAVAAELRSLARDICLHESLLALERQFAR
jgi:glucose-6-phosphate dehydrogenase assembly protein OpcA